MLKTECTANVLLSRVYPETGSYYNLVFLLMVLIYPCSLGLIVSSYLQTGCNQNPLDYCQSVVSRADHYSGFNLITANFRFIIG